MSLEDKRDAPVSKQNNDQHIPGKEFESDMDTSTQELADRKRDAPIASDLSHKTNESMIDRSELGVCPDFGKEEVLFFQQDMPKASDKAEIEFTEIPKMNAEPNENSSQSENNDNPLNSSDVLHASEKKHQAQHWLNKNSISSYEKTMLPEFFTNRSSSKTPEIYMKIRNYIVELWEELKRHDSSNSAYVSATACRSRMRGDVNTILRVHHFLESHKIINFGEEDAAVEGNASQLPYLQEPFISDSKNERSEFESFLSSKEFCNKLVQVAVESFGDWEGVSKAMENRLPPDVCAKKFVDIALNNIAELQSEAAAKALISNIASRAPSNVFQAALSACLREATHCKEFKSTDVNYTEEFFKDVSIEASCTSLLALCALQSEALAKEMTSEIDILFSDLLAVRMQQLEAKSAQLDALEKLYDAEIESIKKDQTELLCQLTKTWLLGDSSS